MKRKSILLKMLVGISVPIILVLIAAGSFISVRVGKDIMSQTTEILMANSEAAANQVSDFFSVYLSGVKNAAASYQMEQVMKSLNGRTRLTDSESYRELKITLDKLQATDSENILAAWAGDFASSQCTQSDNFTTPVGWDITTRPWYRVKDTKEGILTEPYVDASTGDMIVSAAAGIFDHATGAPIGAVGNDIRLSQLNTIMSEHKIGKTGFIILVAENGQIIYHPNADNIQKNIAEIECSDNVKNAFTSEFRGSLDYTMQGVEYSGAMCEVGKTGWHVLSGIPMKEAMESYNSITRIITLIFIIGLLILIVMIYFIAKGITKPLNKLAVAANRIAAGDFDVEVGVHSGDETGLVADALEKTVDQLRNYMNYIDEIAAVLNQISDKNLVFDLKYDYAGEFSKIKDSMMNIRDTLAGTMGKIRQTSEQVASGSGNVSGGSQALAQGASEQASSVEELSATISEISEQVKQNAADSTKANEEVGHVSRELVTSNERMKQLTDAMGEISQSSGEIGKIIKTIEDIAFQTNILALNAAVEAARAGAAGKGFAVVADEVRNLAQKSSDAAKSTTKLIQDSVHSVEKGTLLARDAADSLVQVVDSAQSVSKTVNRISEASERQAESIGQIAIGIDQIASVVQTNSATAEESAAASGELSRQAQELEELVNQFQI